MPEQRDKILSCACDLYLEDGLDGFSMRKLAKQVGVTAPALYRHFQSREHVLLEVVRQAHHEFTGDLYRALEGRTPLERLSRAADAYLDFALKNPQWYQLLFISAEQLGAEDLPPDLEAQGCAIHQFWVDRVRECMDARILKEGDPVQTSLTMWAHAHGMMALYHLGHFRMDETEFRRLFEESGARLIAGVGSDEFAEEVMARLAEGQITGVGD